MCLMLDQFLWGHLSRVCDISCFEWLLKTGFTVMTTYMYFHLVEFVVQSEIFSQLKGMGSLGSLPWKVIGHILKSWDNDLGPP